MGRRSTRTPTSRPIPEREPDQPTVVSRPQSALPPPPERTPVDDLDSDPDIALDERDDGAEPWVAALLGALDDRRVRGARARPARSARSSPSSSRSSGVDGCAAARRRAVERIEGGWQEFADTAADYGYPIRPNATRAEQAATVGGLAPLVLASVVDRAVFAPDGPTDGDDHRVWDTVDELQERLGAPRSAAASGSSRRSR